MPPIAGCQTSVDDWLTPGASGIYNKQTEANAKVDAVDSHGTDFDTLLTRGALGALVLAGGWAVLVVAAVALEAHTGGRIRLAESAGCPPRVRLWLLGAFVAVFAGVAPASASDTGSGTSGATVEAALDGLPLPDRVAGAPHHSRAPVVVVQGGDSLWRIARRRLPAGSADHEVAAAVAALYAANHRTIGPDPDHLVPGQRLLVDDPDNPPEAR